MDHIAKSLMDRAGYEFWLDLYNCDYAGGKFGIYSTTPSRHCTGLLKTQRNSGVSSQTLTPSEPGPPMYKPRLTDLYMYETASPNAFYIESNTARSL